ncbi:GerAB/ArcD/ProY family transporter [Bacillus sp. ISL-75]|uniref:GerAB/ArcD/ProY family transporter n=1 Tax=Bacillus sp. ISL-75 TaxID=2819137 RepID=UPI001BEC2AF1|nr:GerAB/ArcD/ProY family transporter [Bacillus sp. ISL-75]MBT2726871.1 GerAB/ArcD/ProY family transporter [Bacillus sp. ISL-75]
MKVNLQPKEGLLVNAFLVMFFIHASQTGVGIVGLPRIVYLAAKHDAWISVFLGGILSAVVLAMMVLMLKKYDSADLYGIQVDIFGKWLGNAMNIFYMIYMSLSFFVIHMNYIEIVQVWIFPDLPTWQLSLALILLTIYAVNGGIRIIVGVAFISVIGTVWMIFIFIVPMQYADPKNLLPLLNTDLKHILNGVHKTSFSLMGFELLMFLYPYVKDKKKVFLYSQIGNLYTNILFTSITMVCITFFAENGLARTIWPVLSMFKIVRLPNLERFEFIAVSFWMLVILPNMCSYLWAASKGFSRIINWKQKKGIWIIGILVWGGSFFIKARYQMNELTNFVAHLGFLSAFCYPILLSLLVLVKKWFLRRKKTSAEAS